MGVQSNRFSATVAASSLLFCLLSIAGTEPVPDQGQVTDPAANCDTKLAAAGVPLAWIAQRLEDSRTKNPVYDRLHSAVRLGGNFTPTINLGVIENHSTDYTHELPVGKATNQFASGRCWIMAGLNALRSELMATGKVPQDFEFSSVYLYFFSQLEKSNAFFEEIIEKHDQKTSIKDIRELVSVHGKIQDGGWWSYFKFLVLKYGVVPKSAMLESMNTANTSLLHKELESYFSSVVTEMYQLLSTAKGHKDLNSMLREIKGRAMRGVWKILVAHLGLPPSEFAYRIDTKPRQVMVRDQAPAGAPADATANPVAPETNAQLKGARSFTISGSKILSFTPLSFLKDFVEFNPDDYVLISANPLRKSGVVYSLNGGQIGPAQRVLNSTPDVLEAAVIASVTGGHPVWFAAHMGKDVEQSTGIMNTELFHREGLYDFAYDEAPKEIPPQFAQFLGHTIPNHAMAIVGVDIPEMADGTLVPVKFKVENTWGDSVGTKGFFHMYRNWFHRYVTEVIIHRKFLDDAGKKLWDEGPFTEVDADIGFY